MRGVFYLSRAKFASAQPTGHHVASNHFDAQGNARMVDVSAKAISVRKAVAVACVTMSTETAGVVRTGTSKKGDVLAVARLAAINATKWTAHLIPLCHTIPIESVDVDFSWKETSDQTDTLQCRVTCQTTGKTGIEMEAMTGATVGALTVYDMLKSVERGIEIHQVKLTHKSGGATGDYERES
ncbi:cyclic pyranopterin monophosphate synthase MoaC [Rhodopirellula sp. MGV]|uniref:cyclic pyranopterin monophosphate synthase MoaC n=1 Tax=Rhodopirellula sp. MGV TaxID=2023130 RepID=UPI000B97227B|nr:cyclic pyranopterin monophosphate synthase MoaC [Rhodopirellula sp. MGV]OYP36955.1 cyclic pyranopterin monophosphate synthase MoaC [Rhodopirellula sp. MGV]PNY36283.1 cyclic pyranopterin monophosphate synthase MoaC [Rhodopirellula baltica]